MNLIVDLTHNLIDCELLSHLDTDVVHDSMVNQGTNVDAHLIFVHASFQNSMISPIHLWTFYE